MTYRTIDEPPNCVTTTTTMRYIAVPGAHSCMSCHSAQHLKKQYVRRYFKQQLIVAVRLLSVALWELLLLLLLLLWETFLEGEEMKRLKYTASSRSSMYPHHTCRASYAGTVYKVPLRRHSNVGWRVAQAKTKGPPTTVASFEIYTAIQPSSPKIRGITTSGRKLVQTTTNSSNNSSMCALTTLTPFTRYSWIRERV